MFEVTFIAVSGGTFCGGIIAQSRPVETTFDHGGLVANAGLILAGTLISRLGLEVLIDRWVRIGSALPGRKILTVVTAMMAGATHIDHVEVCAAGGDRACSAVQADGSFHGRDIPSVLHVRSHPPTRCRAVSRPGPGVAAGSGPGATSLVIDLDSTICEVHGPQEAGRRLRLHQGARLSPAAGHPGRHRRGAVFSDAQRLRRVLRGVVRFVDELVANLKRAGATGSTTVRADSGFWSWKLIRRLDTHKIKWSITVALQPAIRTAIEQIPDAGCHDIDYTIGGCAQVAETTYVTGGGRTNNGNEPCASLSPNPTH